MLGDDDVAFDRRERQPRKRRRHGDDAIGLGERSLGVAIGKFAHRDFVGLGFGMHQRRRTLARGFRIDRGGKRRIVDLDQLSGILGDVAALRHDDRDRLADIAYPLDRERPLRRRDLHGRQERIGQFSHVLAGDDRPDAVMGERRLCVDARDVGMRVRRADDMSVQGADGHRQVVGIAPAAGQQRGVLLAQHFLLRGFCLHYLDLRLVIASEAKQSSLTRRTGLLRRFAPRNDDDITISASARYRTAPGRRI